MLSTEVDICTLHICTCVSHPGRQADFKLSPNILNRDARWKEVFIPTPQNIPAIHCKRTSVYPRVVLCAWEMTEISLHCPESKKGPSESQSVDLSPCQIRTTSGIMGGWKNFYNYPFLNCKLSYMLLGCVTQGGCSTKCKHKCIQSFWSKESKA